ncbi:TPA: CDGSH iron-sulfur domain-containing protein [Candidatus Woesearchaeota archaeon]|nr:CDGSH iron-sulfur domain-containing protein [Candidatus Woesearchaeota archaeon]HIH13349.1 CDGSH iron-sulfur domain-containing protein [Candidatus Woesearchaeota archaeon]
MTEKPIAIKPVSLQANTKYSFCTCGQSKTLPFCDESHKQLNEEKGTCYKSLKIWPKKDVEIEVYSGNWEQK